MRTILLAAPLLLAQAFCQEAATGSVASLKALVPGERQEMPLAREGRWVLIYSSDDSAATQRLWASLERAGIDASRITQLRPDKDAVRTRSRRSLQLIDPAGVISAELDLTQTPTLIGLEGSRIVWRVNGIPGNVADLRALIMRWTKP